MLTFLLAYLGGVLTIVSPCVLPVVPFIFSRSDQPFSRSGLPMLIGMALSFSFFAALSVIGGQWVSQANQVGRTIALLVFGVVGLSLLFPRFAERLTQPLVRLGGALQKRADSKPGIGSSLLLGASIGLLWAPCAGPILGLVLAGAAFGGSTQKTFLLLAIFAAGAATSLGLAIFAGGKVLRVLKKGFVAEEWIKKFLGVTVLVAVVAIALGLDTRILSRLSYLNTNALEQNFVSRVATPFVLEGPAPSLQGANQWLNSAPLTVESLRGKVILIDFWTYSCINCLRTLPSLKAWAEKYRDQGLVVVGVHSPEFAFEKNIDLVKKAVLDLGIHYPVAIDNDRTIWGAYRNLYWPAHYFIDGKGEVRAHHFGEGNYAESEETIRKLLRELPGADRAALGASLTAPDPRGVAPPQEKMGAEPKDGSYGVEAASNPSQVGSPETYLGYARQSGYSGTPEIVKDGVQLYQMPEIALNHWALDGAWKVSAESATAPSKKGKLAFRFKARDLHLVMGAKGAKGLPYRVTIDGKPPGENHGQDVDAEGKGELRYNRLYQLIRLRENKGKERQEYLFQIEFLDNQVGSQAEVYAFTFG